MNVQPTMEDVMQMQAATTLLAHLFALVMQVCLNFQKKTGTFTRGYLNCPCHGLTGDNSLQILPVN